MRKFEDLNYYETLEIPFNASNVEVMHAYKEALSIYNEESLITYSFFTDDERERVLKKIEEAFLTLIDENKKAEYDRGLVSAGKVDASVFNEKGQKRPIPLFQPNISKTKDIISKRIRNRLEKEDIKKISNELNSKESISGSDLKNYRKAIGIGLEEIFEVTRINVSILKSIEDDHFEKLPPFIYLRNFIRSYSEILQMDPDKVVEGYMNNMR